MSLTRDDRYRHEIAKAAAEGAYNNCKTVAPLAVPQLLFAPIVFALENAGVKAPRKWKPVSPQTERRRTE